MGYGTYDPEAMDLAASEAEQELDQLDMEAVTVVADWWKKNYLKAGHKRLARILLQNTSDKVS